MCVYGVCGAWCVCGVCDICGVMLICMVCGMYVSVCVRACTGVCDVCFVCMMQRCRVLLELEL